MLCPVCDEHTTEGAGMTYLVDAPDANFRVRLKPSEGERVTP